ncbi:GIP, partial [Symbiodinium necroappetens]
MQRVAPYHQDKTKVTTGNDSRSQQWHNSSTWNYGSRRSSWDSNTTSWEAEPEAPAATQAAAPTATPNTGGQDEGASEQSENSQRTDPDNWSQQSWWHRSTWSPWDSWGYDYGWSRKPWSTTSGATHPPLHALSEMDIQKFRKAELQTKLRKLGEEPPTRWTKKELAQRLLELEPSLAEKPTKKITDLQEKIKALGVAARKKSTLTTFCEEIGVDMRCNHNMWSMEQAALRRLYDVSTPAAEDYVGFGQHSNQQYRDILVLYPAYKDWVLRTAKTATADYRLLRLANWLEQQSAEDIELYQTKTETESRKGKGTKTPTTAA